jgi:hypothetical protein
LSETRRKIYRNTFEKYCISLAFFIRIYHNARFSGCQLHLFVIEWLLNKANFSSLYSLRISPQVFPYTTFRYIPFISYRHSVPIYYKKTFSCLYLICISPQIYPTTGYVTIFLSTIIDIQYKYTMGLNIAFVSAKNWLT